jgi:hypothetical protein
MSGHPPACWTLVVNNNTRRLTDLLALGRVRRYGKEPTIPTEAVQQGLLQPCLALLDQERSFRRSEAAL